MTWIALAEEENFAYGTVGIWLGEKPSTPGGDFRLLKFEEGTPVAVPPAVAMGDPSFRIQGDAARALYEALARHFGHNVDASLRKDLEREHARVDKLHDAVIDLGRTLSHKVGPHD
jgi:hypothetical protein